MSNTVAYLIRPEHDTDKVYSNLADFLEQQGIGLIDTQRDLSTYIKMARIELEGKEHDTMVTGYKRRKYIQLIESIQDLKLTMMKQANVGLIDCTSITYNMIAELKDLKALNIPVYAFGMSNGGNETALPSCIVTECELYVGYDEFNALCNGLVNIIEHHTKGTIRDNKESFAEYRKIAL